MYIEDLSHNKFSFKIPGNDTGKERFWQVNMYFADKREPEKDPTAFDVVPPIPRHYARAELCFLQVSDSLDTDVMFNRDKKWEFKKFFPNPDKMYEGS